MPKYVVKSEVVNADYSHAKVSVPVEAANAGAARQVLAANLDRQVAAGTLLSYGTISVRRA